MKKVKVLCSTGNHGNMLNSPQPLLATSASQKNFNMVKTLQQINSILTQNSMSQVSNYTTQSTQNGFHIQGLKTAQSTKNLLQTQPQISLVKSPKQPLSTNLLNIPLTSKNGNQNQQKLKQLQIKASGILMQKCESHASLLNSGANSHALATAQKQLMRQSQVQQDCLSPQSEHHNQGSTQQKNQHHRRQSSIASFNATGKTQQKSLSPTSSGQSLSKQAQKQYVHKHNQERVKSLESESLEAIHRTVINGSYEFSTVEKNKRMTQHIRISPQKQFIVQPCTQQTSPKDNFKKLITHMERVCQPGFKLQLKNPEKKSNLILEQDDYLLPVQNLEDDCQTEPEYSINKGYQKLINHDHRMTKHHQLSSKGPKESEVSINQGFLTDRQQQSSNIEIQKLKEDSQPRKKTKGISYTRNAQELKKLLSETGMAGNLGLTTSLATAAAGMLSEDFALKNEELFKTGLATNKSSMAKVKENQIFCFSARNKSSKQIINHQKENVMCLMETKLNKKPHHQKAPSQLQNSAQTQLPYGHALYQTLDQNVAEFPQSTNNQQQRKLKEFILKEDDESQPYNQYLDDQVIFQTRRQLSPRDKKPPSMQVKRSPSTNLLMKDDASSQNTNLQYLETEQFIQVNERKKGNQLAGSTVEITKGKLPRCWTAHGDISTERERYKSGFAYPYETEQTTDPKLSDESRAESGVPSGLQTLNQKFNQHKLESKGSFPNMMILKRQSGSSSGNKKTQNLGQSPTNFFSLKSILSDAGSCANPGQVDMKDLEILKFKMISFVKTYESEFRKMKMQMQDLKTENSQLKKKLNTMQNRRLSNQSVGKHPNPTCLSSIQNSQMLM